MCTKGIDFLCKTRIWKGYSAHLILVQDLDLLFARPFAGTSNPKNRAPITGHPLAPRTVIGMPKIVRFHQVGGPEVLQLEELPAPQPGEGEVRIKVEAIGLNRAEVMFRSGQYHYQPRRRNQFGLRAAREREAQAARCAHLQS
jgi:hypothetical protein